MIKKKEIIDINKPMFWAIESFSNLVELGGIDVENKICHPILMEFDTISNNGAMYDRESTISSIEESSYIKNMLIRGMWKGELGHPSFEVGDDENTNMKNKNRFFRIEMNNVSHTIKNYRFNGNSMESDVQINEPKGNILWDWMKTGSNISFSLRALTPTFVEKKDNVGNKYIFKYGKMVVITFDSVISPGMTNANIVSLSKYDATTEDYHNHYKNIFNKYLETNSKAKNFINSLESADVDSIIKSNIPYYAKTNLNKDIKTLVQSQESLNVLEDLFEFSSKDAIFSMDDSNIIIKPNIMSNEELHIPVDTYVINKIIGSKRKILNK